jgi:zinc transporter ZupT
MEAILANPEPGGGSIAFAFALTLLAFFIGIGVIALIDGLVPAYENPHEIPSQSRLDALSPGLLGLVFAAVAGVMVYISLDELLPAAEPRPPFTWLRAVPSRNC